MQKPRKRTAALACMLALCLCGTAIANTQMLFRDSLAQAFDLSNNDIFTGLNATVLGNTVYRLFSSGNIYAWDPVQDRYSRYAHVPATPWATVNVEIPLSSQCADVQSALTESVSQLIPAEDGLYGFNELSGRIGKIDADGWHVNNIRLDTAAMWSSHEAYPEPLRNAFISEGKLYAFHDIHYSHAEPPQPRLLVFDLRSGLCTATAMPDTIIFCRYTSGKLLCLQDNGSEIPVLTLYDIVSGQITELDITVPVSIRRELFSQAFYLHFHIGGLAYDPVNSILYLVGTNALWRSVAGTAFTLAAKDLWPVWDDLSDDYSKGKSPMSPESEAWVLTSGGYVVGSYGPLYVNP